MALTSHDTRPNFPTPYENPNKKQPPSENLNTHHKSNIDTRFKACTHTHTHAGRQRPRSLTTLIGARPLDLKAPHLDTDTPFTYLFQKSREKSEKAAQQLPPPTPRPSFFYRRRLFIVPQIKFTRFSRVEWEKVENIVVIFYFWKIRSILWWIFDRIDCVVMDVFKIRFFSD